VPIYTVWSIKQQNLTSLSTFLANAAELFSSRKKIGRQFRKPCFFGASRLGQDSGSNMISRTS